MSLQVGPIDKKFSNAMFYMDVPEIRAGIIDVYQEADLTDIFMLSKAFEVSKQAVYHTRYADREYSNINTAGATITGSGTSNTLTITGLPSDTYKEIYVSQTWSLPNQSQVRVQKKELVGGVPTITIKNLKDSTNITLVAGTVAIAFSNAQGQAGGKVDPLRSNHTMLKNQVGIIRSGFETTDIETASVKQLTDIKTGENILIKMADAQMHRRHRAEIAKSMILSEMSSTLFTDENPYLTDERTGQAVQTTRGFHAHVRDFGLNQTATGSAPTMLEIAQWNNTMSARRFPLEMLAMGSNGAVFNVASTIKNLYGTGVQAAKLEFNSKMIDLDIEILKLGNRTFKFTGQQVFDSEQMPVFVKDRLYMVPAGLAPVQEGSGSPQPYIRLRYQLPKGGAKSEGQYTLVTYGGALGEDPQGHDMVAEKQLVSYVGLEIAAPQLTAGWKVANN